MENASKALIIAGAILLSILLISLGIMIFTQAQDVISGSGMSKAELQTFNSTFTKYENDNVRGSVVRSLMQEAIASNADQGNIDAGRFVTVTVTGTSAYANSTGSNTSGISNTSSYDVKITKYENGRVSEITVTKK